MMEEGILTGRVFAPEGVEFTAVNQCIKSEGILAGVKYAEILAQNRKNRDNI